MDATFWLVLGTFLMVLVSMTRQSTPIGDYGTRRLERKVDLILSHLGIDASQGMAEKLLELTRAGRKIEAIKFYRQETGLGLKEAKDYVESL